MSLQYIYGIHAVGALLANPHRLVRQLYVNSARHDARLASLIEQAQSKNITVVPLSLAGMNQRFVNGAHQGIVAEAESLPGYGERDLEVLLQRCHQPHLILILDRVTDPHNLGACLRSADAAKVDMVIMPKDNNASMTAVVSKVACGAAESVTLVRVTNLVRAMEMLKQHGVWIYGACGEAEQSIYTLDLRSSVALVMGAEGQGIRRLTKERCDGLFALPMRGAVSSLNVSVATGISLYEALRQRLGADGGLR